MKANNDIKKLGFEDLEDIAEIYMAGNISDFKRCAALMTVPEAINLAHILKERYNYDLSTAFDCIMSYGYGIPKNN